MNCSCFHMRLDYIFIHIIYEYPPLPRLLGYLVVEVFPIRNLPADFPLKKNRGFNLVLIQLIFSTFVAFTFIFSDYVVAY